MQRRLLLFTICLAITFTVKGQEKDIRLLEDLKPHFGLKLGLASTNFFPDKHNPKYQSSFTSVSKGYPPRPGVQGGFIILVPLSVHFQVGLEGRYSFWQGQLNTSDPGRRYKTRITYSTFEFPVTLRYKLKPDRKGHDWYLQGGGGYTYTVREHFHLESKLTHTSIATTAHAIFVSSVYLNGGIATKRKLGKHEFLLAAELNSDFLSHSTRLIPSPYVNRLPIKYVQASFAVIYFFK